MPRKAWRTSLAVLLGTLVVIAAAERTTAITIFMPGTRAQSQEEVWQAFDRWVAEEVSPDIRLEWVFGDFDKLKTMLAAGEYLDAWMIYSGPDFFGYVENGFALDLTPYFEAEGTEYWFAPALFDTMYKGRNFGLPVTLSHYGDLLFNRRLFDELGVAHPEASWTTDDLTAAVSKLTRDRSGDGAADTWGIAGLHFLKAVVQFTWGAGGDILTPDGRQNAFGRGAGSARVLEWVTDFIVRGQVDPKSMTIWQSEFMSGNTGMVVGLASTTGAGFITYAQPGYAVYEDMSKTVIPVDFETGRREIWASHGGAYMINAKAEDPDLVWRVLKTLVEHRLDEVAMKGALPSIPVIRRNFDVLMTRPELFKGDLKNRETLLIASNHLRPYMWPSTALERAYTAEWEAVYRGEQPVSVMVENLNRLVPSLVD